MATYLTSLDLIHFPDQDAWLTLELVEDSDRILVNASIYKGRPEPLKTPENRLPFDTVAEAEKWGEQYAEEFLSGPNFWSCEICGEWTSLDPHCCGNRGPRIGNSEHSPICVRSPDHAGNHQAHPSWDSGGGPLTWKD